MRADEMGHAKIDIVPMSDIDNVEEFLFENYPDCPEVIPILPLTGRVPSSCSAKRRRRVTISVSSPNVTIPNILPAPNSMMWVV